MKIQKIVQKSKGFRKYVVKYGMIYEEYIDVLMNNPMNYKMNIMHIKNHDLHSTSLTKTSL